MWMGCVGLKRRMTDGWDGIYTLCGSVLASSMTGKTKYTASLVGQARRKRSGPPKREVPISSSTQRLASNVTKRASYNLPKRTCFHTCTIFNCYYHHHYCITNKTIQGTGRRLLEKSAFILPFCSFLDLLPSPVLSGSSFVLLACLFHRDCHIFPHPTLPRDVLYNT